jgi:Kyakuja-Dileera-Zisupton transposase
VYLSQNSWHYGISWKLPALSESGTLWHIVECFPKFSLNFVKGTSEVEGEILETLWSVMDEVAGIAQAMSVAHHQEVIDAHINDSNW